MPVYFVQVGTSGPIKIGFTRGNPRRRLHNLRNGNPDQLRLIGVLPGDETLEVALHQQFSADRLNGEWFSPSPELLSLCSLPGKQAPQQADTALEFLRQPGNRTRIRRLVERLTGRRVQPSTTTRWAQGAMEMSAPAEALIELVRRNPELMESE